MQDTFVQILPILLFAICLVGLAVVLLVIGQVINPKRSSPVKRMPYESGMDPIHDTRRRFDVRFHLMAIAFLVFDVELLFLYPWAVTARPAKIAATAPAESEASTATGTLDATAAALRQSEAGQDLVAGRGVVFAGVMVFVALLVLGFVYDWRKGVFDWR